MAADLRDAWRIQHQELRPTLARHLPQQLEARPTVEPGPRLSSALCRGLIAERPHPVLPVGAIEHRTLQPHIEQVVPAAQQRKESARGHSLLAQKPPHAGDT